MTIENASGGDDVLEEVSCGCSLKVSIHSTVREAGSDVVGMKEMPSLRIPAGKAAVLEPGGLHLMLEGVRDDIGARAVLVLRFSRGGEIAVTAPVRRSAASGGGHGHHGH